MSGGNEPSGPVLALLGVTGRLGGHVLAEACTRGLRVRALVRDPARLAGMDGVEVVGGDARDPARVAEVVRGAAALVSALGTRRGQEPYELLAEAAEAATRAVAAEGVRRAIVVASAGILQADATSLRRDAPGYPEAFRRSSAAHLAAWRTWGASGLGWTIVCPPELVEGPRDQALATCVDYLPPGPKRVAMPALARWMVDRALDGEALHQRIGVANAVREGGAAG